MPSCSTKLAISRCRRNNVRCVWPSQSANGPCFFSLQQCFVVLRSLHHLPITCAVSIWTSCMDRSKGKQLSPVVVRHTVSAIRLHTDSLASRAPNQSLGLVEQQTAVAAVSWEWTRRYFVVASFWFSSLDGGGYFHVRCKEAGIFWELSFLVGTV